MSSTQRIVFDSYDDLKKGSMRKSQNYFLKLLETHDIEIKSTGRVHFRDDGNDYEGWLEFVYGVHESRDA
jgi:hypothetical protein